MINQHNKVLLVHFLLFSLYNFPLNEIESFFYSQIIRKRKPTFKNSLFSFVNGPKSGRSIQSKKNQDKFSIKKKTSIYFITSNVASSAKSVQ